MSRKLGLAILIGGLGGCSSSILLGNPHPDGGPDAGPIPTVEVLPDPVDFRAVAVGTPSGPIYFQVLNAGKTPVQIAFSPPPTGFVLAPAAFTATLQPGEGAASCNVMWTPTSGGPMQGKLAYRVCGVGAGASCSSQSLALQGIGLR
jgi:hypothetical protein